MKDYYNYFNAYGPYWGTAASAAGLFYNSWKSSRAPYNSTDWKLPKSNITGPPGNTTGPPWNPDKSRRSPAVRVSLRFKGGGSKTITEEEKKSNNNNMIEGSRLRRHRSVKSGRKKFKLMKLVSANLNWTTQQLGLQDIASGNFLKKNLVSEFDPGTGGCIPIFKSSNNGLTPMHVYDLNHVVGNVPDNVTNYPTNGTNQATNINNRAWYWSSITNKFASLNGGTQPTPVDSHPRYYIDNPVTTSQDSLPGSKIYRKGICIDFMLYGCRKTYTEYDVRVIKCLDNKFCPDYDVSLTDDPIAPFNSPLKDFQQAWQSLVYPYVVNPMLKGIEPGPSLPKRWFKTIAMKRITVGEQNGDLEQVTAHRGRIYVNLNEVNNMSWDLKAFDVASGAQYYDVAPNPDADSTENSNLHTKPHYRARYYLVIRALCPQDIGPTGNQDSTAYGIVQPENFISTGQTIIDYVPTYDLNIRTTYATLNSNV